MNYFSNITDKKRLAALHVADAPVKKQS